MQDSAVIEAVKVEIILSPFKGEGHRKIGARMRRKGLRVRRDRLRELMMQAGLGSPHRVNQGKSKSHDGKITVEGPNQMLAIDATKVQTRFDGWVWIFFVIDHWNGECLGQYVGKRGDRHAALEALGESTKHLFGSLDKGAACGMKLRADHGSQFMAEAFQKQIIYWGYIPSMALVGEPETNGVVERFNRTYKEQVIHGAVFETVRDLQEATRAFAEIYNSSWLLEKLNYQSPLEARMKWSDLAVAI